MVPFFKCLIAACLQFFAYYGITTFLPTYLTKQGLSITHASWWVLFSALAGLVGNVVASYTNDRWGRRVTLCYLAATAAVGGIILFLTWQYLLTSSWILLPFFILYFGCNAATVFGVLFSEMFSSDLRSTGVSAALQIGRGLAFFPPLIAASMSAAWGYQSVVLVGALEFFGTRRMGLGVQRDARHQARLTRESPDAPVFGLGRSSRSQLHVVHLT